MPAFKVVNTLGVKSNNKQSNLNDTSEPDCFDVIKKIVRGVIDRKTIE